MKIKSFLRKMILFTLVFFIISEIGNTVYIATILSYSKIYRAEKQFKQKKDSIHILVAGDSHPRWAVYPILMDGVFVIATANENYIHTFYRLNSIINQDDMDIKLVLLPIDLNTFSSYREDRLAHNHYWRKYINYWELGLYKKDLLFHILSRLEGEFAYFNGVEELIEVLKIKAGIKEFWIITDGHKTTNDDFSLDPDPLASADYRVGYQIKNKDVLDEDIIYYFFRTLDLLSSHEIDIVLIKYPVVKEYYISASEYMDINEHYKNLSQLLNSNGYVLPVLDYHDTFWNQNSLFSDAEHLNITGAKVFTLIMKEDLTRLGVYPVK